MLSLTLIVCVVSIALVTLFSGIAMMGTLWMLFMASGFQTMPQSYLVVNGVFVLAIEWMCVSVVNGFVARRWFPHLRGGLFVAALIPAVLTIVGATAFWSPFDPTAILSSGMPHGDGPAAAAPVAAVALVLVESASGGPHSGAELRAELAFLMVISAAGLTVAYAGLTAVSIALLWALPSRKWRHRDAAIRLAAVQGHRNRAVLRWVAAHEKDPALCQAAQERQAAL